MFELFLGHLVGDYLLQNDWMALNKSKKGWIGWLSASTHCIIYTLSVCLIMWNFDWMWMVAVFLSHFPIDRFSLGEFYLNNVKGLSLKKFANESGEINRIDLIRGGFVTIVYTLTDNTMHLLLMWGAYKILY